jgi:hypothetical protein
MFKVRGVRVEVLRGQTGYSSVELADRWRWSRGKVNRFLVELKNEQQIVQQKSNVTTLITIVNYEKYQTSDTANDTDNGTLVEHKTVQQTVQQTDTNKNDNNINNENNKEIKEESASVFGGLPPLPPASSFDLPMEFFTQADFNGLPDKNCNDIIVFHKSMKDVDVDKERIYPMWEVFKGQYLTGTNPYKSKDDFYRHFHNFMCKRSFSKKREPKSSSEKKEKVVGVEYLNDFSQCRMSDGSIKDLTPNQRDNGKYHGHKPNTIK